MSDPFRTAGAAGEDGERRGIRQSHTEEGGWQGGLHRDGYPGAGEKTKTIITTERQMPSEPPWLLSTLHRLTHGSLTTLLCVVFTVTISPVSQVRKLSNGVIQLHGSAVMERGLEPRGPGSRALALIHRSLSMQEAWEWGCGGGGLSVGSCLWQPHPQHSTLPSETSSPSTPTSNLPFPSQ